MALGAGDTEFISTDEFRPMIKISESKIFIINDWFESSCRMLEFTGSGAITATDIGDPLPGVLAADRYTPISYPFSNRVVMLFYDNQTVPGETHWEIGIVDISTSIDGAYTIYDLQDIVGPSANGLGDSYGLTMVTASTGYMICTSNFYLGDTPEMFLYPFSVSGNSLTMGSPVVVAASTTTGDVPVHAFGDGDGNVVVFWNSEISGSDYKYYGITSGLSIGSADADWTTVADVGSWGQGINQRQQMMDRYSAAWGWLGFGDYNGEYNRMLKVTSPQVIGPIEQIGAYPPSSQVIGSGAVVTVGLGAQGVFAWKETATGTDPAYAAYFDLDEVTGEMVVDQGSRIGTSNVLYYHGFYPMLGGTEAALLHRNGSASYCQAITGLAGYTTPPEPPPPACDLFRAGRQCMDVTADGAYLYLSLKVGESDPPFIGKISTTPEEDDRVEVSLEPGNGTEAQLVCGDLEEEVIWAVGDFAIDGLSVWVNPNGGEYWFAKDPSGLTATNLKPIALGPMNDWRAIIGTDDLLLWESHNYEDDGNPEVYWLNAPTLPYQPDEITRTNYDPEQFLIAGQGSFYPIMQSPNNALSWHDITFNLEAGIVITSIVSD